MPAEFRESGLRFQYPENWKLLRDEIDHGWIVEVQSPDTAFLMVCLRTDHPACAELLEQSLADLRSDYPELDAEIAIARIANHDATGYDVRFFSLDLTNTCYMRCFTCRAGTVLLLWQLADLDADRLEPVLGAIIASLHVDGRSE